MKKLIGLLVLFLFTSCANYGLQSRKHLIKNRTHKVKHCRYKTVPSKTDKFFIRHIR